MCSIIGSFSVDKLQDLRTINIARGSISHSLGIFAPNLEYKSVLIDLIRQNDLINFSDFNVDDYCYKIGHSQAPTAKTANIHPAEYKSTLLWHNGLIKGMFDQWDTAYICKNLYESNWEFLSTVNGSFACIYYDENEHLYVFRNEIAPLFVDQNLNISSTKFDDSTSLEPNVVFKLDLNNRIMNPVATFKTFDNPYDF